MAVTGSNCTELVLMARNMHMALVATPGVRFRVSRSFMARSPSGVAAFANPSMLAAIFISIEPIAGCATGTSGNSRRMTGRNNQASAPTNPDFSASRIIPSHNAMIPTKPIAMVTPSSAISIAPVATSFSRPKIPPKMTAAMINPSQMKFSMPNRRSRLKSPVQYANPQSFKITAKKLFIF